MSNKSGHRRKRPNRTGRNEGGQFIKIPYVMALCEAWRSLSGPAVKVWIELRCRYNGNNNGNLSLSWDEGARLLGLGKTTVGRAFKELEAKGFIVMTQRGQWYGRMATTWAVTDRSLKGHLATHEYRKWRKPKKRKFGSLTDHIAVLTGPPENRDANSWSATEPVTPTIGSVIGTETDHLYSHGMEESNG